MEPNRFSVAFSFAGAHREKVRAIAIEVSAAIDPGIVDRSNGRVFYDEWFEHEILGPNMRLYLQSIYFEQSLLVLADLSDDYADRPWCQAENEAIDALRMSIDSARDETARLRLLNVKFGDGRVPGVLPNAGYLDATKRSVEECAALIVRRHALLVRRMGSQGASPPLAEVTATAAPPLLFVHPATNDDRYTLRERELAWLDNCAKSERIRIAAVTGQGGLGKTSLVGHWIEKRHGWEHRAFRGVFFYSFYSNRDPTAFFRTFLEFVCNIENIGPALLPNNRPPHHLAAFACKRWNYLVVLDGLEILQHGEDDPAHYGWIADGQLTEFVARVGAEGGSLLVLTSRFPFPRITDEHPHAARALELPLFTRAEGADLLSVCGLTDPRPKLENYSEMLGGHPLALRIFAGACLEQPFDEPEAVSAHLCSPQDVETMPDPEEPGLSGEDIQKRRQRRQFYKLLRLFQHKLIPPKRRLLQLVALFRDPVPTGTLIALATGVEAMKHDFADSDGARITGLLEQLRTQSLLQQEASGDSIYWTAHPIVRDVFRDEALAAGDTVAQQFAEIVAGKGEGKHPRTVAEVLPIVESIEVLLAAGDFRAANTLFYERLENGAVFSRIPAPQEGLRCARSFTDPQTRRAALQAAFGCGRVAFHLNSRALWASNLGEMNGIVRGYEEIIALYEQEHHWIAVCIGLQNIAEAQLVCGDLREAVVSSTEALFYAGARTSDNMGLSPTQATAVGRTIFPRRPAGHPLPDPEQERDARTYRAQALSLMGKLAAASHDFVVADAVGRAINPVNGALHSLAGFWWACHRHRLGETDVARYISEKNRAVCEERGANADLARCCFLIGELDFDAGNHVAAATGMAAALRIFRYSNMGKYLPDVLLAMARLRRADRMTHSRAQTVSAFSDDESALSHCEEALRLAARSGFLLKKCDALNLRAQLLREVERPAEALSDAQVAHEIALQCDYYWGCHEALRQLRDTHHALDQTAEVRKWDEAEKALSQKMAHEFTEALRINSAHDAKMRRLYET